MGKYHDEKIEIMRKYLGKKILKPPADCAKTSGIWYYKYY